MKAKTEEFLYLLLWATDKLMRPYFHNVMQSYESWAYRNGVLRQAKTLERRGLVERDQTALDERVYRLTEQGRLHALGGRDPELWWRRPWDGYWRVVLFDVPVAQNTRRARLRRYFRDHGFGCLQKSVWITPDPLDKERQILADDKINVESLILLEARPCAGESDTDIVAGAWDFERINRRYARCLKVLDERPNGMVREESEARALRRWAAAERDAWLEAVTSDPLLPAQLLPPDYLGQTVWQRRVETLQEVGRQIRTFQPPSP